MLNRFFELKDFIDVSDPDLAPRIPSASETMIVQDLFKNLKIFESVSKKLQEASVTMLEARILFDSLLERFPGLDYYILSGINGKPVMNRATEFELAVWKALEGNMLKSNEKAILSVFQIEVCVVENYSTKNSFADAVLAKKAKCETFDLKWIPPTSNKAERLFSRVSHIFTDYRKSLSPINLEAQIIQNVNKKHWNVFTVQEIIYSN